MAHAFVPQFLLTPDKISSLKTLFDGVLGAFLVFSKNACRAFYSSNRFSTAVVLF